jgi:cysteine desulfurase
LLERSGCAIRRVPAQTNGIVSPDDIAAAIDEQTAIVTIIHAQNEIGTIQPVSQIAREAKRRGALVHTDAAQSVGKIPVSVKELGVDLLTIAGHKLYAPKGVGALYVRNGVKLPPLVVGAGQERGIRPGTENVAFIVGLGAACAIASRRLDEAQKRVAELSAELLALLKREVPGLVLVGDLVQRLPNTLNVLFPNASGNRILEACPEVMASTGSACHADSEEPSASLTGIGISPEKALGAIRLSVGRSTTREDIQIAGKALAAAWRRVATETIEISEVGSLMGVNQ